jgi:general secretion pathway protein H
MVFREEKAITVTSRAGSNSHGFSLLELVLVLMVLALSSSIVLPNIEKKLEERAIRVSALGLAAVARHLRSRALDEGVPQRLVVNVSQNSYRGEREGEVYLPSDVKFADVTGGEVIDQGMRQFTFFPNGSSYGGAIALRGGQHSPSYSLHFEPLTGRIEVRRDDKS